MIANENKRENLGRKRNSLLQIGLLASTSLMLAAFTYKSPNEFHSDELSAQRAAADEVEYTEVEKQEEKVEKPVEIPKMTEDDQDKDQDVDLGSTDPTLSDKTGNNSKKVVRPDIKFKPGIPPLDTKKPKDPVIEYPDKEASFPGGYNEMLKFINTNLDYPGDAITMGAQGKMYLSFVVEKNGELTDIKILDEYRIYPSLDKEAKRIVRSFPNWEPGEKDAEVVRTKVLLPINFVIGE